MSKFNKELNKFKSINKMIKDTDGMIKVEIKKQINKAILNQDVDMLLAINELLSLALNQRYLLINKLKD